MIIEEISEAYSTRMVWGGADILCHLQKARNGVPESLVLKCPLQKAEKVFQLSSRKR